MNQKIDSSSFLHPVKLKLILSAFLLLATALGFNALFNFTTLDKLITDTNVLKFHVIGEDLKRNIKQIFLSGESTHVLENISNQMDRSKHQIETLYFDNEQQQILDENSLSHHMATISIYLPQGQLLYSTAEKTENINAILPFRNPEKAAKTKHSYLGQSSVIFKDGIQYLQFPVQDIKNEWIATILISVTPKKGDTFLNTELKAQIIMGVILFVSGCLILGFCLNTLFSKTLSTQEFPRKKSTIIMFLVIATILIVFSSLNTLKSVSQYLDMCQKKVQMNLILVKQGIEKGLSKGQSLTQLTKKEATFQEMIKSYPDFDSIIVLNGDGDELIRVHQKNLNEPSAVYQGMADFIFTRPSFLFKDQQQLKFGGKNQNDTGSIIIRMSKGRLIRELFDMALNAVTVVAISLLFLVELLIFIFHFIDRPVSRGKKADAVPYGMIRPVTFLFLFGIDISISFIPLHMENLFTPIFGLSRDAAMGLPISVEFFFVGIAIFFCGFWNDRRGWYEPFITGLFLAGTGVLYSWLAPNVFHFILSRAIVGIGYGLTLLAAQGFVIAFSDEQTKAQAFSQFIAGIYAGSICGGATGALLAGQIGYRWVFLLGAIILYSIIAYSLIFMRRAMIRPKIQPSFIKEKDGTNKMVISRFLKNRIVLSLIILSSLPASIAAVGFLNYFSPIYLNRIGASQATIGRVLMVYGFSLVYLGPIIGKFVDRGNNKRNYVFVGCVLGSVAFLMFYFLDGLFAATIAVLLLGLSNSYIIASQSTYLLKLKVTHALGAGKAIGIFRATSRIGQALGPIVFSGLIMSQNIRISIAKLGIFYLMTALLFLFFTQKDTNQYARNTDV